MVPQLLKLWQLFLLLTNAVSVTMALSHNFCGSGFQKKLNSAVLGYSLSWGFSQMAVAGSSSRFLESHVMHLIWKNSNRWALKQLGSLGISLHLYIFCPQISSAWKLQGSRFLIIHWVLPRCVFRERESHTESMSAFMTLTYPTFMDRVI